MRLFAKIAYDGSNYAGWQRQPKDITVQSVLEDALSLLYAGTKTPVVGCGRTDAGVHADGYILHFDVPELRYDIDQLTYKWDKMMPSDISVKSIRIVADDAHARFDAIARSYTYYLHTTKTPFKGKYSTFYPSARDIDIDLLNKVARMIQSHQDFATFCKTHTDVKTTLCDVSESYWTAVDHENITYRITANRFLRGMVRLIVGTSINVALGKLDFEDLSEHVHNKTKPRHHYSAPGQGLFLDEIIYPY